MTRFSRIISVSIVIGTFSMSINDALSTPVPNGLAFVLVGLVSFTSIVSVGSVASAITRASMNRAKTLVGEQEQMLSSIQSYSQSSQFDQLTN